MPLILLAIYLIWGFTYVAIRIAVRDVGPVTLGFGRAAMATLLLVSTAVVLRRVVPRMVAQHRFAALVGVLNVTGLTGLMSIGVSLVPAGEASLVTYTQPLQVALLSAVFLGERLARPQLLGLLLGFGGMVVVLLPKLGVGSTVNPLGYAVLLLGAFAWALSAVVFRRGRRPDSGIPPIDVVWLSGLQAAYGAVPLLVAAVLIEGLRVSWTPDLTWSWLFAGFGAGGVANLLWFYLLTQRSATVISAYIFLVPAFAVAFGGLVLGEPLTPALVVGGLLTLTGIILVSRG